MALTDLKIYPSGFLGSKFVSQTQPMDLVSTARQLFNKALLSRTSHYTASVPVLELWSSATSGADEYNTFAFKEKILQCALSSFGEYKLIDWIEAQFSSPEFSDTHSKWIDETIMFVYGGYSRELDYNTWLTILSIGGNTPITKTISPVVKKYLYNADTLSNRKNDTIKRFILNWVRQSNGVDDLLASLNVLFGKR
jgi:hypothetical protein